LARLRELDDQLYQPINFFDQQEDPPITSAPNYRLHNILINEFEINIAVGFFNPLYQYQLEKWIPQSPHVETLILGAGGSVLPPSPPNPSPPPSGGEYLDEESSSSKKYQALNNFKLHHIWIIKTILIGLRLIKRLFLYKDHNIFYLSYPILTMIPNNQFKII
jgi:hypothetical protein